MNLSLKEQDQIIKFFANSDAEIFNVTPEQVEKIKIVWKALLYTDKKHDYTFIKNFTQLKKIKI